MEERYEWISLEYYDQESATDQWDISTIFEDYKLERMIEEFEYAQHAYFIKHNYETKVGYQQTSFRAERIGFILLLQTKAGPLELRFGIVEKERGHGYLKDALTQLKEIIKQNESVMDYRSHYREKEKELQNSFIYTYIPVKADSLNAIISQYARNMGVRGDQYFYSLHGVQRTYTIENMPQKQKNLEKVSVQMTAGGNG